MYQPISSHYAIPSAVSEASGFDIDKGGRHKPQTLQGRRRGIQSLQTLIQYRNQHAALNGSTAIVPPAPVAGRVAGSDPKLSFRDGLGT